MNAPSSDPSPDALRKIAEEALKIARPRYDCPQCGYGVWCDEDELCDACGATAARIEETSPLIALARALLASSARVKELEAKASALEKAAAGVQIELDVHFGIDGWPSDLSNAVKRLAVDRDAVFRALSEPSR